ncbi:gas vesicle protein [Virgibacillus halodenitrificans]|uniref:Gas vesicle protein n=1 Tax=Virgibacillus halodenitrificans TaxID=1482 RepID=A0AAC9IYL3_VIRHA|nr:gas vesicle protein [Virgibacillus halodenitrificans]APC47938.1 gas vesicle protein [Virgibacillus halodenitrificans]MCG1028984.1 gas vesicle protein [Virgibacillus halodenitrificans]MCJ0933250.1 gas vesicle protein [Virgibacillus halodenitrificans]MEC2160850.1 gas vesicle protein [Virgibacillus halodenitrificans]WHX27839.1 gas vesicle protein [Virgibacillus halodenitrificans]
MAVEHPMQSSTIVDVLEKVLDKGVVIAGDIRVGIADVELLTIKIRLIVASVDKAKEIGMDWWETDPYLSSKANENTQALEEENKLLKDRLDALESQVNTNNRITTESKSEG